MFYRKDYLCLKVFFVVAVSCLSASCTKSTPTSSMCSNEAQKGQLYKGILRSNPVVDLGKELSPDVFSITEKVFALPVLASKDDVTEAMGSKPERVIEMMGMSQMRWVFAKPSNNIIIDVSVYGNCISTINVSNFVNGEMTFFHRENNSQINL